MRTGFEYNFFTQLQNLTSYAKKTIYDNRAVKRRRCLDSKHF